MRAIIGCLNWNLTGGDAEICNREHFAGGEPLRRVMPLRVLPVWFTPGFVGQVSRSEEAGDVRPIFSIGKMLLCAFASDLNPVIAFDKLHQDSIIQVSRPSVYRNLPYFSRSLGY